jgi:hypothetical protein
MTVRPLWIFGRDALHFILEDQEIARLHANRYGPKLGVVRLHEIDFPSTLYSLGPDSVTPRRKVILTDPQTYTNFKCDFLPAALSIVSSVLRYTKARR